MDRLTDDGAATYSDWKWRMDGEKTRDEKWMDGWSSRFTMYWQMN